MASPPNIKILAVKQNGCEKTLENLGGVGSPQKKIYNTENKPAHKRKFETVPPFLFVDIEVRFYSLSK